MDGKHTDASPRAAQIKRDCRGWAMRPSPGTKAWHLADWGKVTRPVDSLQVRIAEAYRNKRYKKMKAL